MNEYLNNRQRLLDKMEDGSALILFSGALKQSSYDESYPFLCNMNFFYLTGLKQEECYLVMKKIEGRVETKLFILDNDEKLARWIGWYLTHEEAQTISSIDDVFSITKFESEIRKIKKDSRIERIYLDLEITKFRGQVNFGELLKKKFEKTGKDIIDVYPLVISLRAIKSEREIEALRYSIEITKQALEKVMARLPHLQSENQVQALFEGEIKALANANTSFETIAASGRNATILHYHKNIEPLEKEGMILLDLGAEVAYYNADISRTYPIDGTYHGLNKTIYEIVLACNKYIIENVKPGLTLLDLQKLTIDFLQNKCLEAKLIDTPNEINEVYFHGVSHHLGLDTHDPIARDVPLEKGMVITVEPGLYFSKYGIGVRIEDDVLVTENGREILSKDIIKEVSDIEAYMKKSA